jgi:hypothetical protein
MSKQLLKNAHRLPSLAGAIAVLLLIAACGGSSTTAAPASSGGGTAAAKSGALVVNAADTRAGKILVYAAG